MFDTERHTVTTTGSGRISMSADVAEIQLVVTTHCDDYSEALKQGTEKAELLFKAVESQGFLRDDLRTISLAMNEVTKNVKREGYEYDTVPDGYQYKQTFKLRVAFDSVKVSQLLWVLGKCGSEAKLSLELSAAFPKDAETAVLKLAMENAKAKAQALAAEAGANLGKIFLIEPGKSSSYAYTEARLRDYGLDDEPDGGFITSAQKTISAEITTVWELI